MSRGLSSGTQREISPSRAQVPLNDLRRQTEGLKSQIEEVVRNVIQSGWYVLGPNVSGFEEEFAAYCGVRHAIGVGNGTDALELALRALSVERKEVVTTANAGMYATSAILAVGAKPVFSDIEPISMTMSPTALEQCITPNTAAVIVTHLYGLAAEMDQLLLVAERKRIPVIEDCAQAHGASRGGRKVGSFGTVGCFSFYPTKNLGALGDGGALTTNNDAIAESMRQLRQYGWRSKYQAQRPYGRNSRLDELQAAILRVKLPHLDGWNDRRRWIMRQYRSAIGAAGRIADVSGLDHVAHLCVVRTSHRDELRNYLASNRVSTDIHYPIPDHRQAALAGIMAHREVSLPHTETASAEILTLPCFPEMTDQEITQVCSALGKFHLDLQ